MIYKKLTNYALLIIGMSAIIVTQLQCTKRKTNEIGAKPESPIKDKKPNIIVIVGESHRADALGIMGHPIVETPNLDKLAIEGAAFTNAYVTTAICTVSRASMLSGQYQERHKLNSSTANFSETALKEIYPTLMKNGGYKIGWIGVFGPGNNNPASIFDYWQALPWKTAEGIHHTDNVQKKTFEFLEKYAEGSAPFCLSINFNAAHEIDGNPATYLVQDRFKFLYSGITIPLPETYDPKYWNSFPDFFRTDENLARKRWEGFYSTPELYQENSKNYYRLLTGVDNAIGSLIQKLKSLGIDKNTIIIYTSDHGFSLGEHGLMGKWYGFEESIHVPLIINDPRTPSEKLGKVSSLALNIDIAPTVLSFAGIVPPATMQGKNLMSIAKQEIPDREVFFYSHTGFTSPSLPKVEGVVTKNFKYMRYIEHDYEELYDTLNDPKETTNLAKDSSYKSKLSEMRQLYDAQKKAVL